MLSKSGHEKGVFVGTVILVSVLLFGFLISNGVQSSSGPTYQYTINGLSCSTPQLTPEAVGVVVQHVIQLPKFLSITGGQPYVYSGFSYITQRTEQIGNTTVQQPDALELGFYTNGAATSCTTTPKTWQNSIDVQVPLVNGSYSINGALIHAEGPGPH
jgi:hypothetical protein